MFCYLRQFIVHYYEVLLHLLRICDRSDTAPQDQQSRATQFLLVKWFSNRPHVCLLLFYGSRIYVTFNIVAISGPASKGCLLVTCDVMSSYSDPQRH